VKEEITMIAENKSAQTSIDISAERGRKTFQGLESGYGRFLLFCGRIHIQILAVMNTACSEAIKAITA
jgi:hypothetical protein